MVPSELVAMQPNVLDFSLVIDNNIKVLLISNPLNSGVVFSLTTYPRPGSFLLISHDIIVFGFPVAMHVQLNALLGSSDSV